MPPMSTFRRRLIASAMIAWMAAPAPALSQRTASPGSTPYRISVNSELVLVNVTVRDRQGNFVKDLKADDFSVVEDGKAQKISRLFAVLRVYH